MRRFLIAIGTALLAVSLLMTGTPAQAGSLSWEDPLDDPTTAAQGSWDIKKVTLDFDGATFRMTMDVKQLGDPPPFGTGQFFAVRFQFGDGQYTFRITQDRLAGENFQFQERAGQSQVRTIVCKTCKYTLDRKANKVTMQIGFDSLTSTLKKLAPGGKIESILAFTGTAYSEPSGTFGNLLWGGGTPGDSAPAPAPGTFTF